MSEQLSIFQRARQAAKPDDPFEIWWKEYPRKKDKESARLAFKKASKHAGFEELFSCVKAFRGRMNGTDETFIPYAATWLNKKRWLDEKPDPVVAEDKKAKRLSSIAFCVKRKLHATWISSADVREVMAAGLVTEQEAKAYGV